MTDRPILFSAPMVCALLAGTKTQTRRVLTAGNSSFGSAPRSFWEHGNFRAAFVDGKPVHGQYLHVPSHVDDVDNCAKCDEMGWEGTVHRLWPQIEVGDRLYVREHWRCHYTLDEVAPRDLPPENSLVSHVADGESAIHFKSAGRFRQGMHMPRWASRITLTVTEVRVQRLQEISQDDAMAEGIAAIMLQRGPTRLDVTLDLPGNPGWFDPRPTDVYSSLWEAINGPGSWEANPWVAAYTFTVERGNIDAGAADA